MTSLAHLSLPDLGWILALLALTALVAARRAKGSTPAWRERGRADRGN